MTSTPYYFHIKSDFTFPLDILNIEINILSERIRKYKYLSKVPAISDNFLKIQVN